MGLIPDTQSPTCPGHSQEQVAALATHVEGVYQRFYAIQLRMLNAHHDGQHPLVEIDDRHELTLDHLQDLLPDLDWAPLGIPLLGAGAYRVVLGLCPEHALKVNPGTVNHNAGEAEVWFSVPDNLLPLFNPVIAVAPGPEPRWLIAARAEPLGLTPANDAMAASIGRLLGLEDLHAGNLGRRHGSLVLLDYGHTANDLQAILSEFQDDAFPVELLD